MGKQPTTYHDAVFFKNIWCQNILHLYSAFNYANINEEVNVACNPQNHLLGIRALKQWADWHPEPQWLRHWFMCDQVWVDERYWCCYTINTNATKHGAEHSDQIKMAPSCTSRQAWRSASVGCRPSSLFCSFHHNKVDFFTRFFFKNIKIWIKKRQQKAGTPTRHVR